MDLATILEKKQKLAAKKAGLEKKEQRMKALERKARTRKLIELGGLVEKAGLEDVDPNILFGAIQEIKERFSDEKTMASWRERGGLALGSLSKNSLDRLIISFPETPTVEMKNVLREKRFKWNRWRKEWYGTGKKEEVDAIVSGCGACVEVSVE